MRKAGKIERALGMNLGLKPHRCNSPKCPYVRRQSRPGVHGRTRRRAISEFGKELLEKQRLRVAYGLTEQAFKNYVREAKADKDVGMTLLSLLERRLDNVLLRAGLASSRREARIWIRHGHFNINGKPVRSPALLVRPGDVISLADSSKALTGFQELAKLLEQHERAVWLSVTPETMTLKVERLPEREELADAPFDTRLVVEYYSR